MLTHSLERGVPGIIAPNAKTLAFLWKCLTKNNQQNDLDPVAVPIPWNERLFSATTPLKIGYFTSLPFLPAFPDTQKTVIAAKDALLAAGHTVVPFQMPDAYKYMEVIYEHIFGDQGKWLKELFEGEPLAVSMKEFVTSLRHPEQGSGSSNVNLSNRERILLGGSGKECLTGGDRLDNIYQKRVYILDILERMENADVDLILSPAFPHPAVKLEYGHQTMGKYGLLSKSEKKLKVYTHFFVHRFCCVHHDLELCKLSYGSGSIWN